MIWSFWSEWRDWVDWSQGSQVAKKEIPRREGPLPKLHHHERDTMGPRRNLRPVKGIFRCLWMDIDFQQKTTKREKKTVACNLRKHTSPCLLSLPHPAVLATPRWLHFHPVHSYWKRLELPLAFHRPSTPMAGLPTNNCPGLTQLPRSLSWSLLAACPVLQ